MRERWGLQDPQGLRGMRERWGLQDPQGLLAMLLQFRVQPDQLARLARLLMPHTHARHLRLLVGKPHSVLPIQSALSKFS